MKRILVSWLIIILAVVFMPLMPGLIDTGSAAEENCNAVNAVKVTNAVTGVGAANAAKAMNAVKTTAYAYAASTISTIDLKYDKDNIVLNTNLTVGEVNDMVKANSGIGSTKGCSIWENQDPYIARTYIENQWGEDMDHPAMINDVYDYAIGYLIYLDDGYDLPASVSTHKGSANQGPITDAAGLTVNVNGEKRTDLSYFYSDEGYRTINIYVPIGKPSTETIVPEVRSIKIVDTNGTDISGGYIELGAGDEYDFESEVAGLKLNSDTYKKVEWSVTGASKPGTDIDKSTGKLSVASDEPESTGSIKVTAASVYDNTKSQSVTVNIVTGLTIDMVTAGVSSGYTNNAYRGSDTGIWAMAEGSHPDKTIKWELTGNSAAGTKIIEDPYGGEGQWLLRVASDETAKTLTAKAYSSFDKTKYDTISFNVNDISYIKTIDLNYDTSKLGIKAGITETGLSSNLAKSISVKAKGLTLAENELQLIKIYSTGIEGPAVQELDSSENYCIDYVFHLDEGYDIPKAYQKYKYPKYTSVSKLTELTVNVNGLKSNTAYFLYADEYRTVSIFVPIKAEIQEAIASGTGAGTGAEGSSAADGGQPSAVTAYGTIETGITKNGSSGTVTMSGLKDKVYTGKKIKQTLTLKFNKTKLKAGKDYKVTYKNNKNVGAATLTIKGLGKFKGSFSQTFKIIPKKASVTKVTPGANAATVKWKAVKTKMSKTRITGYQVQYSTSSKFKPASTKTKNVKGAVKSSVKLTKLKSKKTYYFRIRTYKKVGKNTYYSKWSAVKKVKVK